MFSAVIRITKFKESPKCAIKSIINNSKYIKDVHIIYPHFKNEEESMYEGWERDKQHLKDYTISASLHVKDFDQNGTIIEIPPNCDLKAGAFDTLDFKMRHATDAQTNTALIPKLKLNGFSIMYGYFMILYLIDWFWNRLFENNKLIQYSDVKSYFIMKKGNKTYFPTSSILWRIWNSETIGKAYVDTATLEGGNIIQTLHNHQNMRIGLWVFIYLPLWFIPTMAFISMAGSVYSILTWAVGSFLTWMTTMHYVKARFYFGYILSFPFYWATFPLILLYSKNI